jgi:hypothetical protein
MRAAEAPPRARNSMCESATIESASFGIGK